MFSVFGAGVGTIPWLLLGELCPSKVKGIASGVTVSVAFVMIFAVVKIFPYGLEYLSPAGTYGFFAGVRTRPISGSKELYLKSKVKQN